MSLKLFTPPEDNSGSTASPEQSPDKCAELRNALDSTVYEMDRLLLQMADRLQRLHDCEQQVQRTDGFGSVDIAPISEMLTAMARFKERIAPTQQAVTNE